MLYMSNDRKQVFKTEQECCKYEQRIETERVKREQLEMERQNDLDKINKKYEELQNLISEYRKKHGNRLEGYWTPFYELVNMMYG